MIATMFALFAAGITLVVASAQEDDPQPGSQFTTNCAACHTEFQMTWQAGAHATAGSNSVFVAEWQKQGNPTACLNCHVTGYDPETATWSEDGITCEACHGPANENHPKEPMPVDTSTDMCGRCHNDTRFGWQEFKVSTHYQRGMDCATCHDPHSTSLMIVPGETSDQIPDQASALCINCHKEYNQEFTSTPHHQQGVSCADCHITNMGSGERPPHTVPDHSFAPNIETCNECHAGQMHASDGTNVLHPTESDGLQTASLAPEPDPVSPIGFSLMAGLIGLAGGMVLAPWLERWYQRNVRHNTEADDEK
jgi:predicted CXXCH cytochrome family protein